MFWDIVIALSALWMLFVGLMMSTENMISFLVIKLLPFVFGGLLGVYALKGFGVL
jgi:hypothetical protein